MCNVAHYSTTSVSYFASAYLNAIQILIFEVHRPSVTFTGLTVYLFGTPTSRPPARSVSIAPALLMSVL